MSSETFLGELWKGDRCPLKNREAARGRCSLQVNQITAVAVQSTLLAGQHTRTHTYRDILSTSRSVVSKFLQPHGL